MSIRSYDFNATPNLTYFSLGGNNSELTEMDMTPVSNSLTYLSLANTGLTTLVIPNMAKLETISAVEGNDNCTTMRIGVTPKLVSCNVVMRALTKVEFNRQSTMPMLDVFRIQGRLPVSNVNTILTHLEVVLSTRTNGTANISLRHQNPPAVIGTNDVDKINLENRGWTVEVDEYQYVISNTTSIKFDITPSYAGEQLMIQVVEKGGAVAYTTTSEITTHQVTNLSKDTTYHVLIYNASIDGVKLTLDGGSTLNLFMAYQNYWNTKSFELVNTTPTNPIDVTIRNIDFGNSYGVLDLGKGHQIVGPSTINLNLGTGGGAEGSRINLECTDAVTTMTYNTPYVFADWLRLVNCPVACSNTGNTQYFEVRKRATFYHTSLGWTSKVPETIFLEDVTFTGLTFSLADVSALKTIRIVNCSSGSYGLSIPSLASASNLETLYCSGTTMFSNTPIAQFPTGSSAKLNDVYFHHCGLDASAVEWVLARLVDSLYLRNGTLNVEQEQSISLSTAGMTNIGMLVNRGWYVDY